MNSKTAEKQLNLLFVTSTLYLGGVQKVTSILANALAERHNVTVSYCFDSGQSHTLSEKCRIRKLPEYDGNADWLTKMKVVRRQIQALKDLKKEADIDMSISLGNTANYINAMSKGTGQIICSERSNPKKSWGKLFFLTRLAYRKADHIIFQSEKVRGFFGPDIQKKSSVLKNPVLIPEKAHEKREKKIITMGRLMTQKNHELLIRSFARFHEQFPEYSLHLFGEGPLENRIKQRIAALGISEYAFLEGNDPEVHAHIRDAEMFVLSSDFEGLSNALLECMAMGIACISTKCEGSTDVIRDGENGLLVDIGDENALTQAMCKIAENPELRHKMETQAAEDLKAYDKDNVTKDWEQVIMAVYEKRIMDTKGGDF